MPPVGFEFIKKLDQNRRSAKFRKKRLQLRAARLERDAARNIGEENARITKIMVKPRGTGAAVPLDPAVYKRCRQSVLDGRMDIKLIKRDVRELLLKDPEIRVKLGIKTAEDEAAFLYSE